MNYHLNVMGIERWHLRPQAENASGFEPVNQVFCYCLGNTPTIALIADADQHNPQQKELMLAIVKAMQQPFAGDYYQVFSLDTLPATTQQILWLGDRAVSQYLQKPVTVASSGQTVTAQQRQMRITHGLQAMLDNKKLKAQTWQDLQALFKATG